MTPDKLEQLKGLVERLSAWLSTAHTLRLRLLGRSRSETFMPGSIAPELLRRAQELLEEFPVTEAATALPELLAEIEMLTAERDAEIEWSSHAEAWKSRALTAEAERDAANDLTASWIRRFDDQPAALEAAEAEIERLRTLVADAEITADAEWVSGALMAAKFIGADNRAGLDSIISQRREHIREARQAPSPSPSTEPHP